MQAVSLKTLLEDPRVEKLMWDCRAGSGALFHRHGVQLDGVVDLQLHCLAWSLASEEGLAQTQSPAGPDPWAPRRLRSLHWALATANHAGMGPAERDAYSRVVRMARILSVPESGGTYDAWKRRPLPGVLRRYCTDATRFFALRAFYQQTEAAHAEALREAEQLRLCDSCRTGVDGSGRSGGAGLRRADAEIELVAGLLGKDQR